MNNLRAFISYRRADSFITTDEQGKPDLVLLERIRAALQKVGFSDVFIDLRGGIGSGTHYEGRIYRAIETCDLFIPVIGTRWLERMKDNIEQGHRDVLVREIRSAIDLEKLIIPVLVDDARMPALEELPDEISELHFKNAVRVGANEPVELIAERLGDGAHELARVRHPGPGWRWAYLALSLLAYYFTAFEPHRVGLTEYGLQTWQGFATVWSGFFIWPIFFVPFALLALYRPVMTLIEQTMNARRASEALTFLTPIVFGTLVAGLASLIEINASTEVPWTVDPDFAGCEMPGEPRSPLVDYDPDGTLEARYTSPPFWLQEKCWPNVFFYLTYPVISGQAEAEYREDRRSVQAAFVQMLDAEYARSQGIERPDTFRAYAVSFVVLIWLTATGIAMTVFFVTVQIRRASDDTILVTPSEDAYLCLTYAFVILMIWVPFRMITVFIKHLYACNDLSSCQVGANLYLYDIILAIMFSIAFLFLTAGLLGKYRRYALSVLGIGAIACIIALAYSVIEYSTAIAELSRSWQFYVGVSIPLITILLALWYQFNPAMVRFNDFRRRLKSE